MIPAAVRPWATLLEVVSGGFPESTRKVFVSDETHSTLPEGFFEFQQQVIDEFRANEGKVGGMFEGALLCLLTTTGAKSGLPRTQPLGYLEVDGQPLVVASAGGGPKNPDWFHNVRRNPVVTVEVGADHYEAIASVHADGAERDALYAKIVEQEPGYGDYEAKTDRIIPVVALHRTVLDADRVQHIGDQLVEVHDWLRGEIAGLRRQLDALVAGRDDALNAGPAANPSAELRSHCLNFCQALHVHHTGEDEGAFPVLAHRFPALQPVLKKLTEEHHVVAELQRRIKALVEEFVPGQGDPKQLRDEFEVLAARLELHFDEEERHLFVALNALGPAPELP